MKSKRNRPEFILTPRLLEYRIAALNLMKEVGLSAEFIESVMQHGSPPIKTVLRAVKRRKLKAQEIEARYAAFLIGDDEFADD